ncbi:RIO kinase family protein (macronuclear) [Tetrahymena thermophila SB210]|uniref:Serine/threonine-protein kinase RIO2 n=1 Tax=Tetrahymena thermophila (strain SB210) TaxID=312017 RepID=Q22Z80_TETTS|nr:RIO kinase family protein [Tetrahymena thermophila SB210]EAR90441.2 RIO kinase family protein [Tetrahymena thermophila SB210]|eukprot:XP_001010686.2 RIO kinase family protein [Tetrahymena thermophila SB210]
MRLDPSYLEYMTKDEFRVLTAIEIGMRNHELVPMHLIERISHLKRVCASKVVKLLLKNKFIAHENKKFDGYKLTYLGYDYLALQVFIRRGAIKEVLGKVGCGKESDIYKCVNENGDFVILKFTRLGRTSFRTIKKNRDYIQHRTSYSWLYLSRLSAIKEYTFMDLLHKNNFPTPIPIEQNRHGIVMSLINGVPMQNISEIDNPKYVFDQCFYLIKRLAENGLIHSDFNEFNLMVEDNGKVIMIDFPQMVSTKHKNAQFYFDRDVECIHVFFERRFNYQITDTLDFNKIARLNDLDVQVKASGFIKKEIKNIDDFDIDLRGSDDDGDDDNSDDENEQNDLDKNIEQEDSDNEIEESNKRIQNLNILNDEDISQDENEEEQKNNKKQKKHHLKKQSKSKSKKQNQEQEGKDGEDDEDNQKNNFSPDLSEISIEDLKELQKVNQDLFSDDDNEDDPLALNEVKDINGNIVVPEQKEKKKPKKKMVDIANEQDQDNKQDLKEKIYIKESELAEKAKAYIQRQVEKQFKQKYKILKKNTKSSNSNKVLASEYM